LKKNKAKPCFNQANIGNAHHDSEMEKSQSIRWFSAQERHVKIIQMKIYRNKRRVEYENVNNNNNNDNNNEKEEKNLTRE